jgi:8-oxo-dGTP pyrophosphatase MutT (NUDIX family)
LEGKRQSVLRTKAKGNNNRVRKPLDWIFCFAATAPFPRFCLLPFAFHWFTVADMEAMDEIVAAGGLVIDSSDRNAPRVLLVHRPKYNDWSFPKGKLDPGETIEAAALREVEEETGLQCRIIRPLPSVRYQYRPRAGEARPKVVHYFLMKAVGGELHVNMYEIDEARWCEVSEAMARLRYEHDRQLLASWFDQARRSS